MAVPRLEVVDSPYRWIHKPLIDFIEKTAKRNEHRLIAVVIPELVEPNWYEFLLHNWNQAKLRAHLFLRRRARTIVINTPWDLHGGTGQSGYSPGRGTKVCARRLDCSGKMMKSIKHFGPWRPTLAMARRTFACARIQTSLFSIAGPPVRESAPRSAAPRPTE